VYQVIMGENLPCPLTSATDVYIAGKKTRVKAQKWVTRNVAWSRFPVSSLIVVPVICLLDKQSQTEISHDAVRHHCSVDR
jgi:hypothetical protein